MPVESVLDLTILQSFFNVLCSRHLACSLNFMAVALLPEIHPCRLIVTYLIASL